MADTTPTVMKAVIWRLTPVAPVKRNRLVSSFRDWHRAHLLGFAIDALQFDGQTLTPIELQRVNDWIAAHGAWRCSALDAHSAVRIFRLVVSGGVRRLGLGNGGAGRWTPGPRFEEILRDGGECVQGEFGF